MEEKILSPGEIIFNKNEIDSRVIFVLKGKIEYFDNFNE